MTTDTTEVKQRQLTSFDFSLIHLTCSGKLLKIQCKDGLIPRTKPKISGYNWLKLTLTILLRPGVKMKRTW